MTRNEAFEALFDATMAGSRAQFDALEALLVLVAPYVPAIPLDEFSGAHSGVLVYESDDDVELYLCARDGVAYFLGIYREHEGSPEIVDDDPNWGLDTASNWPFSEVENGVRNAVGRSWESDRRQAFMSRVKRRAGGGEALS